MPRILHLGTGNFHRAHQAAFTQEAGGWTITGVSLRSRYVIDRMKAPDFDYTLAVQGAEGTEYRQITVIDDILFAPDNPDTVIKAIASADLISLTITEKGYCLGPDGELDVRHADIKQDFAGANRSAIALLARGLARRKTPVAVLSCDNLTHNGATLCRAVQSFAELDGLTLSNGIVFPNTMVDRITPATTDALRAEVRDAIGIEDQAPVATEPFAEWVIEAFDLPRPDWQKAGAQFVPDVAPFEMRKLRLLNGAHSTLAYAGIAAGHEFVHEAIGDPALSELAQAVMAEAAETLPSGIETEAYAAALIERFANPSLHHSLRQIAMDGSQKLPVRLFETIRERQSKGLTSPALWAGVEAWVEFAISETKAGRRLDDPLADVLAEDARATDPKARLLKRLHAPDRDDAP